MPTDTSEKGLETHLDDKRQSRKRSNAGRRAVTK